MSIPVLNSQGLAAGEAAFSGPIAEQEIKPHVIHETVVSELGARRAGTHATKDRSEVRGGGRKPWRQKGTGRARQGSIRAPQWRGGGVVFGPSPRTYGGKVNRKVRAQAFRAALRAHADRGSLALMDATGWDAPSTKRAKDFLFQAPEGIAARPLLVVLDDPEGVEGLSFRNLRDVYVLASAELEVVDLMAARSLLVQRSVWERIIHGEVEVTEVSATAKEAPSRTAPPEPKRIEKAKPADKPKRGRRKGAAESEPAEAEAHEPTVAELEEAEAVAAETATEEAPIVETPGVTGTSPADEIQTASQLEAAEAAAAEAATEEATIEAVDDSDEPTAEEVEADVAEDGDDDETEEEKS